MNDIVTELEKSNNKVYQYFIKTAPEFIESKSKNSFSFQSENGKELDTLKKVFGEKAVNDDSFEQATNGHGNEIKRILTMHSSALLALLFFQSVSKENPISFKINGKPYTFTEVQFEATNPCIAKAHPSSVDVMLTNEDKSVVLFLESKLSEYLHPGKQTDISAEYLKHESGVFDNDNLPDSLHLVQEGKTWTLTTQQGSCTHYCQGIKQMMCHLIGAINYKEKHVNQEVLLGTILLDLSSIDKPAFENYCNDYEQLARKLNKRDKAVTLIEQTLTYQRLYEEVKNKYNIVDTVIKFYGLAKPV